MLQQQLGVQSERSHNDKTATSPQQESQHTQLNADKIPPQSPTPDSSNKQEPSGNIPQDQEAKQKKPRKPRIELKKIIPTLVELSSRPVKVKGARAVRAFYVVEFDNGVVAAREVDKSAPYLPLVSPLPPEATPLAFTSAPAGNGSNTNTATNPSSATATPPPSTPDNQAHIPIKKRKTLTQLNPSKESTNNPDNIKKSDDEVAAVSQPKKRKRKDSEADKIGTNVPNKKRKLDERDTHDIKPKSFDDKATTERQPSPSKRAHTPIIDVTTPVSSRSHTAIISLLQAKRDVSQSASSEKVENPPTHTTNSAAQQKETTDAPSTVNTTETSAVKPTAPNRNGSENAPQTLSKTPTTTTTPSPKVSPSVSPVKSTFSPSASPILLFAAPSPPVSPSKARPVRTPPLSPSKNSAPIDLAAALCAGAAVPRVPAVDDKCGNSPPKAPSSSAKLSSAFASAPLASVSTSAGTSSPVRLAQSSVIQSSHSGDVKQQLSSTTTQPGSEHPFKARRNLLQELEKPRSVVLPSLKSKSPFHRNTQPSNEKDKKDDDDSILLPTGPIIKVEELLAHRLNKNKTKFNKESEDMTIEEILGRP